MLFEDHPFETSRSAEQLHVGDNRHWFRAVSNSASRLGLVPVEVVEVDLLD